VIGSSVDSHLASKKEEKMNTHEEIATLAYELWERRGHPLGSPEIDWHAAESALDVQDSRGEFSLPGVRFESEEGAFRES
jgi:Protein of unknown function (DUF2934)